MLDVCSAGSHKTSWLEEDEDILCSQGCHVTEPQEVGGGLLTHGYVVLITLMPLMTIELIKLLNLQIVLAWPTILFQIAQQKSEEIFF